MLTVFITHRGPIRVPGLRFHVVARVIEVRQCGQRNPPLTLSLLLSSTSVTLVSHHLSQPTRERLDSPPSFLQSPAVAHNFTPCHVMPLETQGGEKVKDVMHGSRLPRNNSGATARNNKNDNGFHDARDTQ